MGSQSSNKKSNKIAIKSPKPATLPCPNNKKTNFKLIALIGFIVSLLLLVFCYYYFGAYFEMNDDPRYVMAMKGFASPKPYNNFVSVYIFTVDLYIFLYKHFPNVGWYGLSMFFLLWGALFNIYITLYLAAKNRINFFIIILTFITFFFLVFFQNVYLINFTRPAILTSASFIILLALLYLHSEILIKNKWIFIFPIITYVLAHLTRLDAGYLGFAFGMVFSFLLIFKQKKIIPFFVKFISPVICFIIIIKVADVFSQKNNTRNHDFLEKTELIRQLIDYKNATLYIPKDAKDTMSYNALMSAKFCSDDKVITIDFLKKLIKQSPLLQNGNEKKFYEELGGGIQSLKKENSIAAIIDYGIFAIMLIWLLMSIRNNLVNFMKYLLFQLFFLAIVSGMSYYMKLPSRIYNPLLILLTFGNIIFLFVNLNLSKKQLNYILLIPASLIAFGIAQYIKSNSENISGNKSYGQINHAIFNRINKTFNNTIFIPTNLASWEIHRSTDPINEINFKSKNCYVYLSIELSLAPETKDQIVDKFGTDDHSKLFKKISEMNNVVFISDDVYNNFLRAYYYYLYNQNYFFEKVGESLPSVYQNSSFGFYRLKKYNDQRN